jgi:hypothetical protein
MKVPSMTAMVMSQGLAAGFHSARAGDWGGGGDGGSLVLEVEVGRARAMGHAGVREKVKSVKVKKSKS